MKRLTKLVLIAGLTVLLFSSCGKDGGVPDPVTESDSTAVTTTVTETEEPVTTEIETTTETVTTTEELVIDPSMAELAKTDLRYEWIYAFLTGDTATCEKLCQTREGVYEELKNLRFSKYSITPSDEYKEQYLPHEQYLYFSFTVTKGIDTLPKGDYCFELRYSGLWGIVWTDITEGEEDTASTERPEIISRFAFCWCDMTSKNELFDYKEDRELWFQMYWTIYCLTPKTEWEAGITADDVRRGGQLMFGIEDFLVDETIASIEDGVYRVPGRGGWGAHYHTESVIESGDSAEYILQYYADRQGLSKSHKVKVTIEKTGDSVYEWCVKDIERIVESKYRPYKYVM